jgi:hypothetical protein
MNEAHADSHVSMKENMGHLPGGGANVEGN